MARGRSELWHGPDRWLHPDQSPPFTIVNGPAGSTWHVAVWWAEVDGQAVPVGIDVRSFSSHGNTVGPPLPGRSVAPVTAALLRGLQTGAIVEQTRRQATYGNQLTAGELPRRRDVGADRPSRARAKRSGEVLGVTKRTGRPPDRDDDFIRTVAELYRQAKDAGGQPARQPWPHVKAGLRQLGVRRVRDGQLRNWYRRAVRLGFIQPKGSTGE